jgi:PAS domain S-box-containing protein
MIARQHTILIVDDCPEDRKAYCRYLGKSNISNYQIIEVESANDGLTQLASIQPDLILLDYLLPDLNGLEFIEELKAQTSSVPPIIMLTGHGNEIVAVKAMKSGVKDYLVKGKLTSKILVTSVKSVIQQHHWQSQLAKSMEQQQLIAETALRIRQSLDLSKILSTAVQEVQLLLNCDRVVIYKFAPDFSGDIVAESVKSAWVKSLGTKITDTCFQEQGAAKYQRGEIISIDNIYESQLSQCYINLLEKFQVKSNLVVPILLSPSSSNSGSDSESYCVWGLLIAHQCSHFRYWQTDEIELLDRLGVQLAIAIQQAELLENLQNELSNRNKLESELEGLVQILEASEDYIGLANLKGQLIWENPRLQEVIGSSSAETIQKPVSQKPLSFVDCHPAWALNIIQKIGIPTAISQGSWLGETALLTQDGREIPVSQLILAHKSPQGQVKYLSTVMRDLTSQKQAEKSLKERTKELEWLNQELVKITSLLKKRNQELDRFAYVTSHDLKAPLRAIANLAVWLKEDLEGQIPEENQQQLQLMQSRVERMDGLIQGLLEYSRIGRRDSPIKTVNIKELVNETIDSLSPPPAFEIIVEDTLPTMETEALPIQQVFANLISNAIKYHHQNRGKIVISAEDQGDCYEFAVADDGPGIEPQYHERIFTIFQTLQSRDTIESTGIGLSIVKKIVEDRGGTVRVESQLNQGATFYFTWYKSRTSKPISFFNP